MLCQLLGRAIVLVRDDQLSLAIGRRGQNVRLASKLVGWDIEIMTAEELDEVIEKAVKAFTKIEGVDTELAERLVEQGILSYDDLSVMEIADLVNTIEGLTEEQAIGDRRPGRDPGRGAGRRAAPPQGGRAAAAASPRRRTGDESPPAEDDGPRPRRRGRRRRPTRRTSPTTRRRRRDQADRFRSIPVTRPDRTIRPCPPNRTTTVEDDSPPTRARIRRRDEASDDEIHDLALAVETSGLSPHGHEVTSPPSDDDQGETVRIVTEAVENGGPAPARSSSRPSHRRRGRRARRPTARRHPSRPGRIVDPTRCSRETATSRSHPEPAPTGLPHRRPACSRPAIRDSPSRRPTALRTDRRRAPGRPEIDSPCRDGLGASDRPVVAEGIRSIESDSPGRGRHGRPESDSGRSCLCPRVFTSWRKNWD